MESAILLAVPEAEPLVSALRLEGDATASQGLPAHVALLYPFLPDPDVGVVEELRYFFAGVDGFDLTFTKVGELPESVYLAPDQAEDCQQLSMAIARRWPGIPPYGGLFGVDEVPPHLTVVDTPDSALRSRARVEVEAGLPVLSSASEASLWVHGPDSWTQLAAFPFAPAEVD